MNANKNIKPHNTIVSHARVNKKSKQLQEDNFKAKVDTEKCTSQNKQLLKQNENVCNVAAYLLRLEMERSEEDDDIDATNVIEFMNKISEKSKGAFEQHRIDMIRYGNAEHLRNYNPDLTPAAKGTLQKRANETAVSLSANSPIDSHSFDAKPETIRKYIESNALDLGNEFARNAEEDAHSDSSSDSNSNSDSDSDSDSN